MACNLSKQPFDLSINYITTLKKLNVLITKDIEFSLRSVFMLIIFKNKIFQYIT